MVEREENNQTYFVGVDGSDSAEQAFQVVMNGLRRPQDTLVVGSVHDSRKDFLPFNQKPNYIKEIYSCKLLTLGRYGKFRSAQFIGGGEDTTKSVLTNLAEGENTDIIVCGMNGRKGPKADHTAVGSTVQYLQKEAICPIVIVKDMIARDSKKDKKYRFGVCFDTSNASKRALRTVLNMMRAEDDITIITIKESNIQMTNVESQVNSICGEYNITHHKLETLERDTFTTPNFAVLKKYLIHEADESNYIDFVACGNSGQTKSQQTEGTLGRTALEIVTAKRLNVIFCP